MTAAGDSSHEEARAFLELIEPMEDLLLRVKEVGRRRRRGRGHLAWLPRGAP